jgi:predicted transcriptional regulator
MFTYINAARKCDSVTKITKYVLILLADMCDDKGKCFPSIKRLEADSGYSRWAISRAIKQLVEIGAMTVARRWNNSNIYTLDLPYLIAQSRERHVTAVVPKLKAKPKTVAASTPSVDKGISEVADDTFMCAKDTSAVADSTMDVARPITNHSSLTINEPSITITNHQQANGPKRILNRVLPPERRVPWVDHIEEAIKRMTDRERSKLLNLDISAIEDWDERIEKKIYKEHLLSMLEDNAAA